MQSETKTARSQRTRAALVAALQERLTRTGAFTADEVAASAGCSPATFWSHFGNKDDAVAAAFGAALGDLVELVEALFGESDEGLLAVEGGGEGVWAERAIDRLLAYFGRRSLLYRAAIARIPESREVRNVFRRVERRTIEIVASTLDRERPKADAIAIIVFCQGLNNPLMLRTTRGDPSRRRLAQALRGLVFGPA